MLKACIITLLMVFAAAAGYGQISNDSLVLWLPFNGNANDASGNGYNGIVTGAVPVAGFNNQPNGAYSFNGNGLIAIPNITKLDGPLTAFTVLVRLKADIIPNPKVPYYTFLSWQRTGPDTTTDFLNGRLRLGWEPPNDSGTNNNDFMGYINSWCTGNVQTASGYTIAPALVNNIWHTVALVYNAGNITVYHNCEIKDHWVGIYPPVSDVCATNPMEILLGFAPAGVAQYNTYGLHGAIDELRIYTRALSEAEVDYFADSICNPYTAPVIIPAFRSAVNPCLPAQFTFTDTSVVKGATITRRVWKISNGDTSTAQQFNYVFKSPGVYKVALMLYKDTAAYSTDTVINVPVLSAPRFLKAAQQNIQACGGASVPLAVTGAIQYTWQPCTGLDNCNTAMPRAKVDNNVTYIVTGKDNNSCTDTLHFDIVKIPDENKVFAPAVFTPNADGHNDYWGLASEKPLAAFNLAIFGRWGQPVFSSKNQLQKWDGTQNGIPVPAGTYVWLVKYENSSGCASRAMKGTVLLMR